MSGDETAGDNQPEEMTVRLRTGLKSCRTVLDNYRALLLDERPAASDLLPPAEPDPPKVDDPA